MDNSEFGELIKQSFDKESNSSFIKKIKIVDTTEDAMPESVARLVAVDVINDEDITNNTGKFEFIVRNYPNIKSGVRLRDQKYERMTLTAENLAKACIHRLNALIALYIYGGGQMGSFILETDVPKDVHTTVSGTEDGIESINEMLKYMESTYSTKYDRITLNGVLLTMLTGEVQSAQAKKLLKQLTGLKVDVDNGYYNERGTDGKSVQRNYVPNDKVILSKSKNDNSDILYFANLPVASEHEDVDGTYGVTGYVINDIAWSVMRGVPVLKDKTAFATITFKLD